MNHIHVLVYEWPVLKLLPIYTCTINFFLKLIIYICLYTNIHAACIVYEYSVFNCTKVYKRDRKYGDVISSHHRGQQWGLGSAHTGRCAHVTQAGHPPLRALIKDRGAQQSRPRGPREDCPPRSRLRAGPTGPQLGAHPDGTSGLAAAASSFMGAGVTFPARVGQAESSC